MKKLYLLFLAIPIFTLAQTISIHVPLLKEKKVFNQKKTKSHIIENKEKRSSSQSSKATISSKIKPSNSKNNQTAYNLTLEDLVGEKEIVLQGLNPEYSFYIPINKNISSISLNFNVDFSKALSYKSYITLYVNKKPYEDITVSELRKDNKVKIILDKIDTQEKFVEISFKALSYIENNEVCSNIFNENLWYKLNNFNVSLSYKEPQNLSSLYSFLRYLNIYTVYSDNTYQYLPWLIYKLKSINYYQDTKIKVTDQISNANIVLANSGDKVYLNNNVLYLPYSSLDLLDKRLIPFYQTKELKGKYEESNNKTEYLTLKELGFKPINGSGYNKISLNIPFNLSSIGYIPKTLYFYAIVSNSSLPNSSFANIEFYLNGNLIYSKSLDKKIGKPRIYDIKVPVEYLSPLLNNLNVVINNYTKNGERKDNYPMISASISPYSYFYFDGKEKIKSIDYFLGVLNKDIGFLYDQQSYNFIPKLLDFFDTLSSVNKNISSIKPIAFQINNLGNYDYYIAVLNKANANTLNPPLKIENSGFTIVSKANKEPILKIEKSQNVLILEKLNYDKKNILLITYTNKNALKYLNKLNKHNLGYLDGDIIIIGKDGVFPFKREYVNIEYNLKSFSYYYEKYKYYLGTSIAIIILVIAFVIKKKVVRV